MTIYIARDNDGSLWLYETEPYQLECGTWDSDDDSCKLAKRLFPNIKPGECVEFETKGAYEPITAQALFANNFEQDGVGNFEWRGICLNNKCGHWRINMNDSWEYFQPQTMESVVKLMSLFQVASNEHPN